MMHRRRFLFINMLIISVFQTISRHATAWELFTKDEIDYENTHRKTIPHSTGDIPDTSAASPQNKNGLPTIEVTQPDISKPVTTPVAIKISFHPQQGAEIIINSFRATYGFFEIDITSRILANARIDKSGLIADNAEIPPGSYAVTLQIADDRGRIGSQALEFVVVLVCVFMIPGPRCAKEAVGMALMALQTISTELLLQFDKG